MFYLKNKSVILEFIGPAMYNFFNKLYNMDASWIAARRQDALRGRLSPSMVAHLNSEYPGWNFESVQLRLASLTRFVMETTEYPKRNGVRTNELILYKWLEHIRSAKERNMIATELCEYLEALPGWSWDPAADAQQDIHQKIKIFYEDHGRLPAEI